MSQDRLYHGSMRPHTSGALSDTKIEMRSAMQIVGSTSWLPSAVSEQGAYWVERVAPSALSKQRSFHYCFLKGWGREEGRQEERKRGEEKGRGRGRVKRRRRGEKERER